MLWLYSCLMYCLQPLLRRKLQRRALREAGYGQALPERFGLYSQAPENGSNPAPLVWVHAVSLGETRAAQLLITQLRIALPGMRLLLTHGTATGREAGQGLLQAGDIQVWQPWDAPANVQRFIQHFRPSVGLLIETEVWPNLVHLCQRAQIPLCLVSARMSGQSLRKALRLAWLSRPAYAALHAVWAQTQSDAQRLQRLGAPVRGVLGNLKFDATPKPELLERGRQWRSRVAKPVLLLAISREGEEQMLLDLLSQHRTYTAAAQWLIVPRHPQRFDEVAQSITRAGFVCSRRSSWGDAPPMATVGTVGTVGTVPMPPAPSMPRGSGAGHSPSGEPIGGEHTGSDNPDVNANPNINTNTHPVTIWLGDSLGEMALYFALADVALLGGSFAPLGGQNLIEAAACACPVVMGAHTFNFAHAAESAQAAGAAFEVAGMQAGVQQALHLLEDPSALAQIQTKALHWSQSHRGAAQRTAQAVAALWSNGNGK